MHYLHEGIFSSTLIYPNTIRTILYLELCSVNFCARFRTDGKSGLKFYTDPDYFFELWRQEMLKEADQYRKVRSKQKLS